MKKLINILFAVLINCTANAQWFKQKIDNHFDPPKIICYTGLYAGPQLHLAKNIYGEVVLFTKNIPTQGQDTLNIEFSYLIGDEYYKTEQICYKNGSEIILIPDLALSNMLEDFIDCTSLSIRINRNNSNKTIYHFNMEGKIHALKFILKN